MDFKTLETLENLKNLERKEFELYNEILEVSANIDKEIGHLTIGDTILLLDAIMEQYFVVDKYGTRYFSTEYTARSTFELYTVEPTEIDNETRNYIAHLTPNTVKALFYDIARYTTIKVNSKKIIDLKLDDYYDILHLYLEEGANSEKSN